LVRDDPELLGDGGEIPKSQGRVGDWNPHCEISSLPDGKLARRRRRRILGGWSCPLKG